MACPDTRVVGTPRRQDVGDADPLRGAGGDDVVRRPRRVAHEQVDALQRVGDADGRT